MNFFTTSFALTFEDRIAMMIKAISSAEAHRKIDAGASLIGMARLLPVMPWTGLAVDG